MTSKSKLTITGSRDDSPGTLITVSFSDGTAISYLLRPDHPLYDDFAAQGIGKKLRDAVSSATKVDEIKASVRSMLAAFDAGKWNLVRNSDGAPQVGLLAKALARFSGKSLEAAQDYVSKLSKKQQADMRKLPELAAAIAAVNAESGTDVSSTDLLSAFTATQNGEAGRVLGSGGGAFEDQPDE
jgi:hypothetical protein